MASELVSLGGGCLCGELGGGEGQLLAPVGFWTPFPWNSNNNLGCEFYLPDAPNRLPGHPLLTSW